MAGVINYPMHARVKGEYACVPREIDSRAIRVTTRPNGERECEWRTQRTRALSLSLSLSLSSSFWFRAQQRRSARYDVMNQLS